MISKKVTQKKDFYSLVLINLNSTTNLGKIQEDLKISKQQLNYYLRGLVVSGHVIKKGQGWYEVDEGSKKVTQYGKNLKADIVRGHGYVWKARLTKKPKNWEKRINILEKAKINYKLVGAMKNIPRIKIYGRKVWLCNNHMRIFENKNKSFYGDDGIKSKKIAFEEIMIVIKAIENKLGINLRPYLVSVVKEHYALIKNDLAKQCNKDGEIIRVSDKDGEWLLIDDSLGEGGELENIGKKALQTNIRMQKWWNEQKETGFDVTPKFILESFNNQNKLIEKVTSNQLMFNENFESHVFAIKQLANSVNELTEVVNKIRDNDN